MTKLRHAPRRASRRVSRRGIALLEFAAVVPVLMFLLLGIMEFGWYARTQLAVANAAREGARSASIGKTLSEIRTRVINSARPVTVTDGDITVEYSINNGASYLPYPGTDTTLDPPQNTMPAGSLARVTVSVAYRRLVNVPIMPSRITMRVTMVRERT